ncbi:MAG: DUF1134 domain-containing protein [Hyphomicrobiaceae bacterium]|nr:DUF1134 domain-containing protein [Hyphomicrobiaceae bacterium]
MHGSRSNSWKAGVAAVSIALAAALSGPAQAQDRLPWESPPQARAGAIPDTYPPRDAYSPGSGQGGVGSYAGQQAYRSEGPYQPYGGRDTYVPPPPGSAQAYESEPPRYTPDPGYRPEPYERDYGAPPPPPDYDDYDRRTFSRNEILDTGHRFFGSVSQGLANIVEYAFQKAGRPNGYILGEDAGGAFVAGLRYGEGTLYTKDAGIHKVYWQGPSVGYDFGGEGSKTMVLIYNLRHPHDIYNRFGGVQGSAYFVGGVGIQFQKHGDVVLAPIRSGIGFRLGANIGYLKYTRTPTWNPF